ncbi:plastocyanin/azurin family copper-binding protein [Ferroplasma sp.]|uniref:plastocyanin/azurin family copper-binding protein n=1 Tax=Ferroplasma sp. TaxID=2591003 RepID=UPI0026337048|nr:plastocyanin/azurin family copper-binding protein [Ferroplasma sp.]
MNSKIAVILAFVVTFALVVGIGTYAALADHNGSGNGYGEYNGNGMMGLWGTYYGSGVYQNAGKYMNQSTLNSLSLPPASISVVKASNSIFINQSTTLLVELSPSMGSSNYTPQEYFEMYGLENPRIIAKQGVTIKFEIVNMDAMEHNLELTSNGPPYRYMSMMGYDGEYYGNSAYYGNSMMYSSFLPPYSGNSHYPYENSSFTTTNSGNYWYICTYPGHAEEGMYGEFTVA